MFCCVLTCEAPQTSLADVHHYSGFVEAVIVETQIASDMRFMQINSCPENSWLIILSLPILFQHAQTSAPECFTFCLHADVAAQWLIFPQTDFAFALVQLCIPLHIFLPVLRSRCKLTNLNLACLDSTRSLRTLRTSHPSIQLNLTWSISHIWLQLLNWTTIERIQIFRT